MELRASFQIPTLIKALTDVVLPAVDPDNRLAQEQAQLIIGSLRLLAQRMPLQYRYDRFELQSFVRLADDLSAKAGSTPELASALEAMRATAERGRNLLARAGAEPEQIEAANLALRESIGAFSQASSTLPDQDCRRAIESDVMAHAKDMLLRERAWLAMQGWEGADSGLPEIEKLIGNGETK